MPRGQRGKSGRTIPYQEFDVGTMEPGTTDPESPDFDNLADWYADGDVLEVRIPWMMLGFTDPSRHEVWDNLYAAEEILPTETGSLRVYPALVDAEGRPAAGPTAIEPLSYEWDGWDEPNFHEREKKSYDILREAFVDEELQDP